MQPINPGECIKSLAEIKNNLFLFIMRNWSKRRVSWLPHKRPVANTLLRQKPANRAFIQRYINRNVLLNTKPMKKRTGIVEKENKLI
jgi:hypothetical protein